MTPLIERLANLFEQAFQRVQTAATLDEIEQLRVAVLGRKGELGTLIKGIGALSEEEKIEAGRLLNTQKQRLVELIQERTAALSSGDADAALATEWLDFTVPVPESVHGHLHPITLIEAEIEELFTSMGFAVMDGPEVETEFYNFDALNIAPDHPAREMQDTFWLTNGCLLRTHTSPTQVRALQKYGTPIRMIAPGRVFRNEEIDASHEHTFYQLEGMMVDRNVSVSNLLFFMQTLLDSIFKRRVTVRLRPGFFPFVEPGFELDIRCLICDGSGCSVCKQTGWVELLPCGLVHPEVLARSGIDPTVWSGFAFGLGLTRLAMMRYGINDIRLLQSGDLRFLSQF